MSTDVNKTLEALGSLDKLHDIITPEPVGFFPLASGWYILLALLAAWLFHVGFLRYKAYQRNRYRRDALNELGSEKSASELLSLAKRVALSAYGREQVARLSGEAWWNFMETYSQTQVPQSLRDEADKVLYLPGYEISPEDHSALYKVTKVWISTHKGGKA
ncbi:DUF4381 domain-containing protein [Sulfurovum sp. NBC37-1]|uniref:DUF4381 domain-containing protein n=1 Tax=Sulfurovum sp. (strain NBC37-1) TaxID=387093 RepID=UPI0001587AB6|nr:DUF4381 domain-containing protein [Sulfurovum sp. NBC37-1]BAF73324.1 conserved hypothetical protein [Sulfurovum sp. NBC37-1]